MKSTNYTSGVNFYRLFGLMRVCLICTRLQVVRFLPYAFNAMLNAMRMLQKNMTQAILVEILILAGPKSN